MSERKFYFENADTLVNHLHYLIPEINEMKLQRGMYFLCAYYMGFYDGIKGFPEKLCDIEFTAGTFGPFNKEINEKKREGFYKPVSYDFKNNLPDISLFIKDLSHEIDTTGIIALTDRSHEDTAWKKTREKGRDTVIDNDDIREEYREKIKGFEKRNIPYNADMFDNYYEEDIFME